MSEGQASVGDRIRTVREDLNRYFVRTIWQPLEATASTGARMRRRAARYLYLVVHGFSDDKVLVRAPALTFTTLLSLVPVLALVYTVAKSFDMHGRLKHMLAPYFDIGQEGFFEQVFVYVERTDVTALGTLGVLIVLYTAVSLLSTIEKSFNEIWGASQTRSFTRKFSDYLSVLLVLPVCLLGATSIVSISSTSLIDRLPAWVPSDSVLRLVPLLVVSGGFTFLYIWLPNTRVKLRPALVGGLIGAVLWLGAQRGYIAFQVGVAKANAIYGTFAALPLFLVWLQVSWIIVLLGAEIAYAVQHEATYHPQLDLGEVSIARREQTALHFLAHVWDRFHRGEGPLAPGDLAAEVELPRVASLVIVDGLVEAGLLARTAAEADDSEALLPARDLSGMGVGEILLAYRHQGEHEAAEPGSETIDRRVAELHARLEGALRTEGEQRLDSVLEPAPA